MKSLARLSLALMVAASACAHSGIAAEPPPKYDEHITELMGGRSGVPVRLRNEQGATTKATFKPPVEILIEAKTDSTNLRMAYAADQVIFNWERARHQLRVDGGPAGGQHKSGAGIVPANKYVTIRWVVTPESQAIYVDGQLRFEHQGDYSKIDSPVSVFCAVGSEVTVKSIKTRSLAKTAPAPAPATATGN